MEDKITLKLSRSGMIAIRQYCEILIHELSDISQRMPVKNSIAIVQYAQKKAACFELRKVCEKMNKATYLRGFDSKEYRVNINYSMGLSMVSYQQVFSLHGEKSTGDYENMVIRTALDSIWKELTK